MDLTAYATPTKRPACWEKEHLGKFSTDALYYHPNSSEYDTLDAAGHAQMTASKKAAEDACVDVCLGCPLMVICDELALASEGRGVSIAGVVGGRTEAERRRIAKGKGASHAAAVANSRIAPGDRGPRNQIDDDRVLRLSRAGKTAEQIARDLSCNPRTVSRARKRLGISRKQSAFDLATATPTPRSAPATTSTCTNKTRLAATGKNLFVGGRPVSAAMRAVYDHLATTDGYVPAEDLTRIGAALIDADDALAYWISVNSTPGPDGQRIIKPGKAAVATADRITAGARLKAYNAISAAHRNRGYLDRDASGNYALTPAAKAAWRERMAARQTA